MKAKQEEPWIRYIYLNKITKHNNVYKHLAICGLSRGTARFKSSCNLIGNRFEMPNVSYTQPLPPSVRDRQRHRKIEK